MSIYKSQVVQQQFHTHYQDVLDHWTRPYESHFVETPCGETHVLTSGNPDGAPLLMLTGGNGIAAHWGLGDMPLADRFHIFAPDIPGQPGQSASDRPSSRDDSYALWLTALLDHFGLDRVHCLGISFGGWLSLKLAICCPERVDRLALLSPAGIVPLNASTLLKMLPRLLFTPSGAEYFIDRVTVNPLDPYLKSSMMIIYNSLKPGMPVDQPLFSDDQIASIGHPTLLLVGDSDILIPAQACLSRAEKLMPDVAAEIVAHAGHIIPSDQPELFAQKVTAHLLGGHMSTG